MLERALLDRTKEQRLLAVVDVYRERAARSISAEEIAAWAMQQRLWPAPTSASSVREREAWEKRFAEVSGV